VCAGAVPLLDRVNLAVSGYRVDLQDLAGPGERAGGRTVACGTHSQARREAASGPAAHNDFLWAKILLLHAENLFIDFGAES
jgi:hypothetical protein